MSTNDCDTFRTLYNEAENWAAEVAIQQGIIDRGIGPEVELAESARDGALRNQKNAIEKMNSHVRSCPICQKRD